MPLTTGTIIHLQGTLAQGEVFDTGFFVAHAASITQAQAQAVADAVATFMTNATAATFKILLANDSAYTQVKTYTYQSPPNGPANLIAISPITTGAGTGTGSLPDQVAIVASLRSALFTRAGRGRMYIPMNGNALTNHQVTSALIATIAQQVKNLFAAAVAAFPVGSNALVAVNSSTLGAVIPVNRIIVDSRPDIQRRRANKQALLFSSTVTVP